MTERRPYTFDRVVRIIFTVCGLLVALYFLNLLKGVLLPFIVACLFCYMFEPVVKWNMRWTHLKSRFVPVMLTLVEVFAAAAAFCMFFFPYVVNECSQMADMIKIYATKQIRIPYISDNIHIFLRDNIDWERIYKLLSHEQWYELIKKTLTSSWSFLSSSVAFIASIVSWAVVLIYILFIMLDYERLMLSFRQLIPYGQRRRAYRIISDIKRTMNRYFRGQSLIALIVGCLFALGFYIIGLPMGIVLGLFIGLLNLVPYLQLISLPITAILCLVWTAGSGGNFWLIFGESMAVYVIVQCIQDLLLTPKIMGKAMGLNPAIILLALSVWGALLGFLGLIIALPLTTLLLSYYNLYVVERNNL